MNRKQKIIVSVVGISIISLALIGLTYGYYLTRIQGNTNDKSISISTANLELTYSDTSDIITGTNIVPGTTLGTKTFTVTNTGNNNVDSYSVGLVNVINDFTRLDDIKYTVTCTSSVTDKTCNGISESTFPNENSYIIENQINKDEVQTYEITVEYKEMNVDQSDDMGKTLEAKIDIFDTKSLTIQGSVTNYSDNDYVVIHSKEQTSEIIDGKYKFIGIEPDTHKITIKNRKTTSTKQTTLNVSKGTPSASGSNITYNDEKNVADADITITGSTVTIDANKIISNAKLLKDVIIDNAKKGGEGRTIYCENPLTEPLTETNSDDEKTLSKTVDDYGDSYYFRGNVIDNFVEFAGMCWKIVRIEGDNSIKLVLAKENKCKTVTSDKFDYSGVLYEEKNVKLVLYGTSTKIYHSDYENSENGLYSSLKSWYISSNLINKQELLKNESWCLGKHNNYRYSSAGKLLTDAEVEDYENDNIAYYYYSGKRLMGIGEDKYLSLKCSMEESSVMNYIGSLTKDEVIYGGDHLKGIGAFTLTVYKHEANGYDLVYLDDGNVIGIASYSTPRPSIVLNNNIKTTGGDGTLENPYKILEK